MYLFLFIAFFFRGGISFIPLFVFLFYKLVVYLFQLTKSTKARFDIIDISLLTITFVFCLFSFFDTTAFGRYIFADSFLLILSIFFKANSSKISATFIFFVEFIAFFLLILWLLSFFYPSISLTLYNLFFTWGVDKYLVVSDNIYRFYEGWLFVILLFPFVSIRRDVLRLFLMLPALSPWILIILFRNKHTLFAFLSLLIIFPFFLSIDDLFKFDLFHQVYQQKMISLESRIDKLYSSFELFRFPPSLNDFDFSETLFFRMIQYLGIFPTLIFYTLFNYSLFRKTNSIFFVVASNLILSANPFPAALVFSMAGSMLINKKFVHLGSNK